MSVMVDPAVGLEERGEESSIDMMSICNVRMTVEVAYNIEEEKEME